jgi:hypothetical protein
MAVGRELRVRLSWLVGLAVLVGCYYSGPKDEAPGDDDPTPGPGDDPNDDGTDDTGSCVDECVPGSAECVGNGVQACRRINGCAQYSPVQPCGAGSVCTDGVCMVDQPTTQANLYIGPSTICSITSGDIYCDVSLCNGGTTMAAASTLKFFLDAPPANATCTDPSIPGEMWLSVDAVAPGACQMTGSLLFFDNPSPGTHRLALFADGLCQATEFDEQDNYVVLTPDLLVAAPMQAELWFNPDSRLYWDSTTGQMWGEISVCNVGSAAAGAFYVDFSANAALPACGFIGVEYQSYPSLAAGACTPMWLTTRQMPGLGFAKSAQVFIDSTCSVVESNENNVWTYDYL